MRDSPIISERELRALVKRYEQQIGLHHPWVVYVRVTNRGELADSTEKDAYAAASSDPNYYRAYLTFDPWHENWEHKEDGELEQTVRHELFHVVLSTLTEWALTLCDGDDDLERVLHDKEEQIVTFLERMPIWDVPRPSS